MNKSASYQIFKNASTTFFIGTLFFPSEKRKAVFDLYAFVRVFDDFVDCVPAKKREYDDLKQYYLAVLGGKNISLQISDRNKEVVQNFVRLQKQFAFSQEWIDAFFVAMETDLVKTSYATLQETEEYMYGSAEVIGLMMVKIMELDSASYLAARSLGKAFQYMNMIRDVAQDLDFNRVYLPEEEFRKYGLSEISAAEAHAKPEQFNKFIRAQIKIYEQWRDEAKQGFHYIPKRYLLPINISLSLFDDTLATIQKNPQIIFEKKVKPSKFKILATIIKQLIFT